MAPPGQFTQPIANHADAHIAVQHEAETAEHLALAVRRIGLELLAHPLPQLLVVRHGGESTRGAGLPFGCPSGAAFAATVGFVSCQAWGAAPRRRSSSRQRP